jgi:hypothetical protein
LASPLPLYPINRDIGRVVAADNVSEQVKVINLYRSLVAHIEANETSQPYLIPIADEIEAIIQKLRERQISVTEALQATEAQAEKIVQAEAERKQSSLEDKAFALSLVLRGHGLTNAETIALAAQQMFDRFPGWPYNDKLKAEVRLALYKLLLPETAVRPPQIGEERGEYQVSGQKASPISRVKQIVDDLLRMSDLVGA